MRAWLAPTGKALIEVYTPWYWAQAAGRTMALAGAVRRYDFDAHGSRMLDTWQRADDAERTLTQSLRCYAPADLAMLLDGTGLRLVEVTPGGSYDAATNHYAPVAPLAKAMSYVATLEPIP
ncbi:MAG: hypothetical protein KC442_01775 [Thermomicrobiales bacterium]|nr:hypothetical protein [Thermomicrobiales bacterium]